MCQPTMSDFLDNLWTEDWNKATETWDERLTYEGQMLIDFLSKWMNGVK